MKSLAKLLQVAVHIVMSHSQIINTSWFFLEKFLTSKTYQKLCVEESIVPALSVTIVTTDLHLQLTHTTSDA